MKMKIYCVKDNRSGWLTPSFDVNDEVAYRNFAHAVKTSGTILTSHSDDFTLYCIGTFDTQYGVIEYCNPVPIVNGGDIK